LAYVILGVLNELESWLKAKWSTCA